MSQNVLRSQLRLRSRIEKNVWRSLQPCKVVDNISVLKNRVVNFSESNPTRKHVEAFVQIMEMLTSQVPHSSGAEFSQAWLPFNEAYSVFLSYSHPNHNCNHLLDDKDLRKQFKDLLLHPEFGLCVYVVEGHGQQYLILRADDVDYGNVFAMLRDDGCEEIKKSLSRELISRLVSSIDTEWDRRIFRHVLGCIFSRSEYSELGLNENNLSKERAEIFEVLDGLDKLDSEARTIVVDGLARRKLNLTNNVARKKRQLANNLQKWTPTQVQEREEEIETLMDQLKSAEALVDLAPDDPSLESRVQYEKQKLVEAKRLKKRKLGSGRKAMMDELDEREIARRIESKSTAHGRRHDSVAYLGHRVKKADFLKIVNAFHAERGLPSIKSATTPYNRGRAKRLRSHQAKRHMGLGLWCCKKAPKSDGRQRAYSLQ